MAQGSGKPSRQYTFNGRRHGGWSARAHVVALATGSIRELLAWLDRFGTKCSHGMMGHGYQEARLALADRL